MNAQINGTLKKQEKGWMEFKDEATKKDGNRLCSKSHEQLVALAFSFNL